MEFLEADHSEWLQMWEELAKDRINEEDPICLFVGNCWEYMGSSEDHHHFRHQLHPRTGKIEFAYIERRRAAISWAHTA
ncbi:hypothetical protein [Teredinibacter purpureus]|uniref:hypothetical protein n=1 Tax=Teredinibacter purpureus TaxID=2731756 RepID=UPI0005F7751C|nr:hypothetical protein [Teredinibacter purpureus]